MDSPPIYTMMGTPRSAVDAGWEHAYTEYPRFAAEYPWSDVVDTLMQFPGERVYEVGFGGGHNLLWARQHGWEVAGCEIAETPHRIACEKLDGADLRLESMVDCSAPSSSYDVVVDRAALTCLSPKDLKKALFHVRRILKPGGVFFFNPYGNLQTKPFPDVMPPVTLWEERATRQLFPDTKWETIVFEHVIVHYDIVGPNREHTYRIRVRKIGRD
jgi:SAM-dependent methyltransferase